MPSDRPLLTIAIPTYNRSDVLDQALRVLMPQVEPYPEIEVLVSDNCSPDDTGAVMARYAGHSQLRYQRHETNIGPDANFVSCFEQARGRYFWLCGDDDIILEGAVDRLMERLRAEEYDLIYVTSYGFERDYRAGISRDAMLRNFHVIRSAREMALTVNIMFTFISGILVNKERLEQIPHEAPKEFYGTMLVQLSWVLPLLRNHRRSLVMWERVVAARIGAATGYSFGEVFGEKLVSTTRRLLPDQPALVNAILGPTLRKFLPSLLYQLRKEKNVRVQLEKAPALLRKTYGRNFRFWLFVWPVAKLPMPLARWWVKLGGTVSKLVYMISVPHFWRKTIR